MSQRTSRALIPGLLLAVLLPLLAACSGSPAAALPGAATSAPSALPPTAATAGAVSTSPTIIPPTPAATTAAIATAAPQVLRIGSNAITGWPENLDPQKAGNVGESAVLMLNYEGLTRLDAHLAVVPGAAERWEYNPDATRVTFTLRPGLTYSDGSPITSHDFRYAVERIIDPRSPGFYQTALSTLEGAAAVVDTQVPTETAQLDARLQALGIETPDDRTISFRFTQPTPSFHAQIAGPLSGPVKQDLVAHGDLWFTDPANQLGNGPFQITAIDRAQSRITLRANPHYWQGRPKIDEVQLHFIPDPTVALQAYKSGELDMIAPDANDVSAILADPTLQAEYVEQPGSCVFTQSFNVQRPPFNVREVREAFAYAFDRDAFLRDAYQGVALKNQSWIPQGYPGYDPNDQPFAFDLPKARQLLAQAGYPDGKGFPEVTYTYATDNPADKARVEYFAQMMRQNLGVVIRPDPVDSATLNSLYGNPDTLPPLSEGGWCGGVDQHDWLSLVWHSRDAYAQAFGYHNAALDQILDTADRTTDPATRGDLYAQAQHTLVDDLPALFYRSTKNLFLVKPYVKGLSYTPQDVFGGEVTGFLTVSIDR